MADLQSTYSGTEQPPDQLRLDQQRLGAFLRDCLPEAGTLDSVAKFKGGQSNPTYLLRTGAGAFVLRRTPPGKLIKGAHAIDREFRVIGTLHEQGFPVPRPWVYCEDAEVIGSPFYIADYVEGRVFWDPLVPGAHAEDRRAIYAEAAHWLARLHCLDPVTVGLDDFGRASGYAQRNLALWSRQYRAAEMERVADMHWLMDALAERVPTEAPTRLIHGDYGIYNIIYASQAPRAAAILDWEMTTLGDPFIDLAHHLRTWWLSPGKGAPTLQGHDLVGTGIPSMQAQIEDYLTQSGLSRIPDCEWYLAYAQFRFAAMVQGVLKRYANGTAANRRSTNTMDTVCQAAASARRLLAN